MKLPPTDVDTLYRVQRSLFSFVNQQRDLFPELETAEDLEYLATQEEIMVIRQTLYDDLDLLNAYVAANPDSLSADDLEIARSWRHLKAGTFYIFRYLKKHTIFLDDGSPPRAYGVLGLRSDFDELLPMRPPIMVEAVLLPLRDKIVFDGILQTYNIYFGAGIRRSLNDSYRVAKERFGIITSLLPEQETGPRATAGGQKQVFSAFHRWLGRYGLRPQTLDRHLSNVRGFVGYLAETEPDTHVYDTLPIHVGRYLQEGLPPEADARSTITSLKKFFQFLRDTGRMDYDTAWDILDMLKAYPG